MDLTSRRERMREWLAVGLRDGATFRDLAHRAGVSERTLRRWSKAFRKELAQCSTPAQEECAFVDLIERTDPNAPRIEIVLPRERRVVLDGSTLIKFLARLLTPDESC